ncbi:unnamed protein product [Effrenium voratum]|nr:unnamed protein product [Effrenium voratum]
MRVRSFAGLVAAFLALALCRGRVLTDADFDDATEKDATRNSIVLFCSEFCPWCKKINATWTQLIEAFGVHSEVFVGHIDCGNPAFDVGAMKSEGSVASACKKHEIEPVCDKQPGHIPAVKYYDAHEAKWFKYKRSLEGDELETFIADRLLPMCDVRTHEKCSQQDLTFLAKQADKDPAAHKAQVQRLQKMLKEGSFELAQKKWLKRKLRLLKQLSRAEEEPAPTQALGVGVGEGAWLARPLTHSHLGRNELLRLEYHFRVMAIMALAFFAGLSMTQGLPPPPRGAAPDRKMAGYGGKQDACGPHYAEKAIYEFTQRLSQLPHLLKDPTLHPAIKGEDAPCNDRVFEKGRLASLANLTTARPAAESSKGSSSSEREASALVEEPLAPGLLGGHFGAWRLVRRLGQGSQGRVYVGRDGTADFAVKVTQLNKKHLVDRFHREVEIMKLLAHPCVVRLLSVHLESQWAGLVMDLAEGVRSAYDMPKGVPSWFADGIPWDTFQEDKPPMVYSPPQWKPGYLSGKITWCDFWTYRACCCAECDPCSCAFCLRNCIPDSATVTVDDPDSWMKKMLVEQNPNIPDFFKGIFWMCDNNAPSENLFSFGDADWSSGEATTVGVKKYHQNYVTPANCFGVVTLCGSWLTNSRIRLEVSPNGHWVNIYGYGGGPGWIYVDQAGDTFECQSYAKELYGDTITPDPKARALGNLPQMNRKLFARFAPEQ